MPAVAVFCGSSEHVDAAYVDLAAEVGAELARRGHTLVSGGGSVSLMGAVARAARAGGAHTTGVIPEALVALEVADHDADELVVTVDMRSRKRELEHRADGFLVLPGGIGTLEELFEIWVSRALGLHAKPLVVLDGDGMWDPLRRQVDLLVERGFLRPQALEALTWCQEPTAAFEVLEAHWAGRAHEVGPPSRSEVLESEL